MWNTICAELENATTPRKRGLLDKLPQGPHWQKEPRLFKAPKKPQAVGGSRGAGKGQMSRPNKRAGAVELQVFLVIRCRALAEEWLRNRLVHWAI